MIAFKCGLSSLIFAVTLVLCLLAFFYKLLFSRPGKPQEVAFPRQELKADAVQFHWKYITLALKKMSLRIQPLL
jgi:hypothetical protein